MSPSNKDFLLFLVFCAFLFMSGCQYGTVKERESSVNRQAAMEQAKP